MTMQIDVIFLDQALRRTFGKALRLSSEKKPDQGSIYIASKETLTSPRVAFRPLTHPDGLVFSLNNDKLYFTDVITRRIACFEYNLKKGEIANRSIIFDFEANDIPGSPNGMTIDREGNIWVATFNGAEVLRIDAVTGKLLSRIKLPVDHVSSLIWGGKNLDILYVTTGSFIMKREKPCSGSLFGITAEGCSGVEQNFMRLDDVEHY